MTVEPETVYRAALIGLGRVAWKYDAARGQSETVLSQAGAMLKNPAVELLGGCSPLKADRDGFVAWAPGLKVYERAEEMLAGLRPDLVGICSPTGGHFRQARLCLEAGVRALWLEKPPTESPAELEELISLAGDKQAVVGVNYTRRYLPGYARLRELLAGRAYGPCRLIRLLYSPGLARNGVHLLDQLFYLTGAGGYELLWSEAGAGPSPCFVLRLSTGHLVQGAGGDWPYHSNDLELVCDNGLLAIIRGGKTGRAEKMAENDLFPGFYDLRDDQEAPLGRLGLEGYMEAALDDIVACLARGGRPRSNLETARLSQRLLNDILTGAGT
ncbi:MAG: Gfo/Idh/MocA family oxidoreductase [Candidatus Adiutrix sp.]|jgi:predicted dehydrogenase|nr:Gfo/Idh/MocA family oxidoreductase [Candidatus Adiutrix sp.]